MRRVSCFLVAILSASPAAARDADSIVFGTQLDSLIEYGDALQEAADADEGEPETEDDGRDPVSTEPGEEATEERLDVIAGRPAAEAEQADDGGRPEFVLRQGYDSNYDESTEPEGSSFTEIGGSAAWAKESEEGGAYFGIGATMLRLHDLDWKDRGDGYVDVGLRREIGDGLALQGGLGLSIDATSDPIEGAGRATLGLEGEGDGAVWGLRANLSAERALHEREPDEDIPGRTYDFVRPEIEASLLFEPEAKVSPFVTASLSRTTFPLALPDDLTDDDDEPLAAPLRDAVTVSLHGGLRLRPDDDLTVSIGLRGNLRRFDQDDIANLATLGPEIAAEWEIVPALSVAATLGRSIGEPEEFGALAEDVTSLSGTVTIQPADALELTATGTFDRTDVYGVETSSDELSVDLSATYSLNPRAALEARYYRYWYRDRVGSDDYDRTTISGGGKLTF